MIEDKVFKSQNFSDKVLEPKVYSSCHFENCNFTESIWRDVSFDTCTFTRCNLSLIKLEGSRLHDVAFVDCKLVGGEFFKCDRRIFSISSQASLFQYCNFSGLNMKGTSFNGSKCIECTFSETNLVEAKFEGVDLQGTIFHRCDLSKANFRTAVNYDIDLMTNKLKKAKFSLPEVVGLLNSFEVIVD